MLISMLAALVPVGIVGYLAYYKAADSLEKAEYDKLTLLWRAKEHELVSWFHETVDDLAFIAQTQRVQSALETFNKQSVNPEELKTRTSDLNDILQSYLELNPETEGFEDFVLIDSKSGIVLHTQKKLADLGANLKNGDLKDSCLGKVWQLVVKFQKPAITDFHMYAPSGMACAAAGVPVFDRKTRELMGVLALRINANEMNEIFSLGEGSGKTAEVYAVGKDLLMRCQSRFEKDPTVLRKRVDTDAVRKALEGQKVAALSTDYRNEINLSVSGLMGLNKQKEFVADFDWVLVSEVDRDEAMAPIWGLALWVLLIGMVVAVMVGAAGVLFARGIARPITAVSEAAIRMSRGDLNVTLPQSNREDEVGAMTEAFRHMSENLRKHFGELLTGVNVLSSAASEIFATVAQLSSSTTETSASVTETTTTLEQLRQAASLANQKSKAVAQSAVEAAKIAKEGKKSADESIEGMNLIHSQMESIGETVVRLSDHSRAIEQIMTAVQDLADQSNLLAVNASIEAARAGDQGKGFAVVAHEIKSLADQSREATDQVRSILDDTRKWVSAAVMATEQGTKAVGTGVDRSVKAGEVIGILSSTVAEASQAVSVIEVSSGQQLNGMDQIVNAMAAVQKATQQNMAGMQQLADSARRLADLGTNLKQLADSYKMD